MKNPQLVDFLRRFQSSETTDHDITMAASIFKNTLTLFLNKFLKSLKHAMLYANIWWIYRALVKTTQFFKKN